MSSVSTWAMCSLSRCSSSAIRRSTPARSATEVARQPRGSSNAARAAATAASTSSGPAWSTVSTTLASNGLSTSTVPPEPAVHFPSTNRFGTL